MGRRRTSSRIEARKPEDGSRQLREIARGLGRDDLLLLANLAEAFAKGNASRS